MATDEENKTETKEDEVDEITKGNQDRNPKADSSGNRIPKEQRAARAKQNASNIESKGGSAKGLGNAQRNPKTQTGGKSSGKKKLRDLQSLAGFDPFAAENRQIVADCKKHRTQGHKLGDKCIKILAMVDAVERGRGGKGAKGAGGAGAGSGAPYTDLNAQWGHGRKGDGKCAEARARLGTGLTESEKYFSDVAIKGLAGKSSLIPQDPQEASYGVRPANCFGRRQKGTIYMAAPVFDAQAAEFRGEAGQQKMKMMLAEFFKNPEAFKATHSNFIFETIAIKVKSMMLEADGEGTEDEETLGMDGAPQPLAASDSELDEKWYLGYDDVAKAQKLFARLRNEMEIKKATQESKE